jgi:hypothetical protein
VGLALLESDLGCEAREDENNTSPLARSQGAPLVEHGEQDVEELGATGVSIVSCTESYNGSPFVLS